MEREREGGKTGNDSGNYKVRNSHRKMYKHTYKHYIYSPPVPRHIDLTSDILLRLQQQQCTNRPWTHSLINSVITSVLTFRAWPHHQTLLLFASHARNLIARSTDVTTTYLPQCHRLHSNTCLLVVCLFVLLLSLSEMPAKTICFSIWRSSGGIIALVLVNARSVYVERCTQWNKCQADVMIVSKVVWVKITPPVSRFAKLPASALMKLLSTHHLPLIVSQCRQFYNWKVTSTCCHGDARVISTSNESPGTSIHTHHRLCETIAGRRRASMCLSPVSCASRA